MRRFKLISLVLCISILGWLLFVSSASAQIKLSYSIFFAAPHKHSVLAAEWGKEIEKRTNGRVGVTMHYGRTLTPAPQVYDGVIKGLSDVGMSVCGYTRGRFPLTEVVELPLGHKSGLAITKTINDFIAQFKPKEFDDVKFQPSQWFHRFQQFGFLGSFQPFETVFASDSGRTEFFNWGPYKSLLDQKAVRFQRLLRIVQGFKSSTSDSDRKDNTVFVIYKNGSVQWFNRSSVQSRIAVTIYAGSRPLGHSESRQLNRRSWENFR